MLVYIAGCYRAKNGRSVDDHIAVARAMAIRLWDEGHYVICPHLNTAHLDRDCQEATEEQFLTGTLEMLRRCDALMLLDNWHESEGAIAEHEYAQSVGMPIFRGDGMGEWTKPLTEKRCPEQCKAFLDTVMRMYRLHLSKNADYSPANILGTGELGLITRLWDKVARLLNLYGFELRMEKTEFKRGRSPKHESIDDSLIDLATYAIIGQLLRADKWGK